jgi:hypothetical protein
MLLPPDSLTPKQGDVVGVLPPAHTSASTQADAIEIRRVFPAAIELSDMLGFMRGYFAMGGAACGLLLANALWFMTDLYFQSASGSIVYLVIVWVLVPLPLLACYYMYRADTTGFRYEPVLFCRGGIQPTVHHFAAAGVSLIPFKAVKADIRSYPWSCVRAEISTFVVGAPPFAGRQNMLRLCITDAPGSNRVVERFNIGLVDLGDGTQLIALWEHLRRYMQEGGPPLTGEGTEKLVPAEYMPLWWALLSFMPVGPDADMWGKLAWWKFLLTPLVLLALPLCMFFGMFRWLSLALKKTPQWPAEILNAAGGASLSKQQVAQMLQPNVKRRPVVRVNGQLIEPK